LKQLDTIKSLLSEELQMSNSEIEIFLMLIKEEKCSAERLVFLTNNSLKEIVDISKELEKKGMVIEVNTGVFRSLHPRFAVVNRYRKVCEIRNLPFKKNLKIDNLAIMVEKYQNN
jgi:hypothetical protein